MERSRLARVKTKTATRQATVYIIISIVIIVSMIVWGVPLAAKLAGMFVNTDNGVTGASELRPTPPVFSDIPEATNSARVTIGGFAQPGVEVSLIVNGQEYKKILSDDAGVFQFENVLLTSGDNTVHALASTSRGTESEQSREYTIILDTTKPELSLISPTDGQVFQGEKERLVTFAGKVNEENTKVYVGDRMAIVQTDGSFSLTYQLVEGDQDVTVKTIDSATNETDMTLKLRWNK